MTRSNESYSQKIETKSNGCRSGWFKAENADIELKLLCFKENETFKINCSQQTKKANGPCHVKWYKDGKLTGELSTVFKDGEQIDNKSKPGQKVAESYFDSATIAYTLGLAGSMIASAVAANNPPEGENAEFYIYAGTIVTIILAYEKAGIFDLFRTDYPQKTKRPR